MLVPGETLLFSPRGMVTATALKWSGYGRQFGGGNYCARDCRWSWRGLRTGRDGKRQQAEQQYSVYRQSHDGFPRWLVGSTIRATFLKRQALSKVPAPLKTQAVGCVFGSSRKVDQSWERPFMMSASSSEEYHHGRSSKPRTENPHTHCLETTLPTPPPSRR